MLSAFLNLNIELMTALLITLTALLIVLGKIFEWGFIVNRPALATTALNWVIIMPLSINSFMF